MPSPSPCPPAERWALHLAGSLPAAEQAELVAHLDSCSTCQQQLQALAAGESLLEAARQPGAASPEPALKQVVDRLKEQPPGELTQESPTAAEASVLPFLRPPTKPGHLGRLGHYEVTGVIGRGGMGVVLGAVDERLCRAVAIKVLAPHLATSGTARQRFLREARAAAAVCHDHVVTIHAVEEAEEVPYLVMQYVSGVSLQERLRKSGPLAIKEVLRIGAQAAAGLAAAHAQGLVHRDVKPANILLENGVERVKLTDFGLARAAEDVPLTQSGCVAGTPMYMSPEQANSEPIDHRSDLFSLGTVLYEMCTGVPPFRKGSTPAVLRSVAHDRPRPVRERNSEVPKELAAVIARLHAKDPAKRYQSAAEVAAVLGKMLAESQQSSGLPASPPAKRRRLLLVAAAACLLAAGVLLAVYLTRPRDGVPGTVPPATDPALAGKDVSGPKSAPELPAAPLLIPPGPAGEVHTFKGHTMVVRSVAIGPDGRTAVSVGDDGAAIVWDVVRGTPLRQGPRQECTVWAVALSPDPASHTVLSGGGLPARYLPRDGRPQVPKDFALRLWSWDSGKEIGRLAGHKGAVTSVAFSPDGSQAVSGSMDGTVRLWDVKAQTEAGCLTGHGDTVYGVAFAPDGKSILSASADRTVRLWSCATKQEVRQFKGHQAWAFRVTFAPDGRHAASAGMDGTVRLWDVETGHEVRQFKHPSGVSGVAFSPDGRRLLSTSGCRWLGTEFGPARYDEVIRLWEVETSREIIRLEGHLTSPTSAVFTPDGKHALSTAYDFTVRLWRLEGPPPPHRPPAPQVISLTHASLGAFQQWATRLDASGYMYDYIQAHEAEDGQRVCSIAVRNVEAAAGLMLDPVGPVSARTWIDKLSAARLRIRTLSGLKMGNEIHYALVAAQGSFPATEALIDISPAEYAAQAQMLRQKKRRPFSLLAYPRASSAGLTVLHVAEDNVPWESWAELTEDELEARLKETQQPGSPLAGYRPLSASAYSTKAGLRYTLLLIKDDPAMEWAEKHGLAPDDLDREARAWEGKGYRPLVLFGYFVAPQSRYLGVWVKDKLAKPLQP
jgi:WD40 repeat protein